MDKDKSPVQQYLQKRNYPSFLALLRDWLVIAAIIILNEKYFSIWMYLPSLWVIGLFQFAISEALLHDAAHNNLFYGRNLNGKLEFLYALPFFQTVNQYKQEHMKHHRFLGTPKDHAEIDYNKHGFYSPSKSCFFLWFIKPLLGYPGYVFLQSLTLLPFKEGRKILIFWSIILFVIILNGYFRLLLFYWIIPLLWSCKSYLYWSEVRDHFNTISGTRSNINIWYNFITHNNGFHYLHHKYPHIPWFNLKSAYNNFGKGSGDIANGFVQVFRQLKKVNYQG